MKSHGEGITPITLLPRCDGKQPGVIAMDVGQRLPDSPQGFAAPSYVETPTDGPDLVAKTSRQRYG